MWAAGESGITADTCTPAPAFGAEISTPNHGRAQLGAASDVDKLAAF